LQEWQLPLELEELNLIYSTIDEGDWNSISPQVQPILHVTSLSNLQSLRLDVKQLDLVNL